MSEPGSAMTRPPPESLAGRARRSATLPDELLLRECAEEFLVAGGPGGQHRNKTESGVRLTHLPTGVVIRATERRSQAQNRSAALERLRARLQAIAHVAPPRRPTRPTRSSKERRLADKRHAAARKTTRRGSGPD